MMVIEDERKRTGEQRVKKKSRERENRIEARRRKKKREKGEKALKQGEVEKKKPPTIP